MGHLGTRSRNTYQNSSETDNDTRSFTQNQGWTYTASTITFTAPNLINDSANGFQNTFLYAGRRLEVRGSNTGSGNSMGLNDGQYNIVSSTAGVITVEGSPITTNTTATPITIYTD